MKRIFTVIFSLLLMLALAACGNASRYQKVYIDYFDTAITIIGYEKNSSDFDSVCKKIESELKKYHQMFDIYQEYDGVKNVCSINALAGKEAVKIDSELFEFLEYSKNIYTATNGQTNIMLGSVLKLWHECREAADSSKIPDMATLTVAAEHCDINSLVLDKSQKTAYITDSLASLDVGAVAKGYAMQKIFDMLSNDGITGYALNFGGMVKTLGSRGDDSHWSIAIEDPLMFSNDMTTVDLNGKALSTSGTYQRYFEVDGVRYHHIIDPDSLMPENRFLAVSVVADDCATADIFSTALFNMTLQEGKNFLNSLQEKLSVMWVLPDGNKKYFGEFENYIIK